MTVAILSVATGCSVSDVRKAASAALKSAERPHPAKLSLAEHLTNSGAKIYGAFWCTYCQKQQELFGAASTKLTVVECDPNGSNAQPDLCTQANISSYPTWEINGQLYRGMRSLDDLANLSNYQGSRDFGSQPN